VDRDRDRRAIQKVEKRRISKELRPNTAFVTLALVVGRGVRGAEARPASLDIPRDATDVRFALTLQEPDHQRYRAVLRAVGGAELLRQDLTPRISQSAASFTLTLPAARFTAADYMLTLQGARSGSGFEDLSQTLIKVRRGR